MEWDNRIVGNRIVIERDSRTRQICGNNTQKVILTILQHQVEIIA